MRFGKIRPGALAGLFILLTVVGIGGATTMHDGSQEVQHWYQQQSAALQQGPWKLSPNDVPQPPSPLTLVETSGDGSAMGYRIAALTQHLGKGTIHNDKGTLEGFHNAICFAVFSMLESGTELGDPLAMARTIDAYLVRFNYPRIRYAEVRRDLEKIYVVLKRASSTDEISRDVTEAILC
jgi:hypothetical protein